MGGCSEKILYSFSTASSQLPLHPPNLVCPNLGLHGRGERVKTTRASVCNGPPSVRPLAASKKRAVPHACPWRRFEPRCHANARRDAVHGRLWQHGRWHVIWSLPFARAGVRLPLTVVDVLSDLQHAAGRAKAQMHARRRRRRANITEEKRQQC